MGTAFTPILMVLLRTTAVAVAVDLKSMKMLFKQQTTTQMVARVAVAAGRGRLVQVEMG